VAVKPWLIDKSAYTRLADSLDADTWMQRIERGLVRISTVTRLEIGYSFRTAAQAHSEVVSPPLALMPVEYMTPAIEDRAREVQLILTDRGLHRAPSIPDLLIAATAEVAGLTVLNLDKDFALISEITGQTVEPLRMG
jgi:predicted nucleic acid-binding protein